MKFPGYVVAGAVVVALVGAGAAAAQTSSSHLVQDLVTGSAAAGQSQVGDIIQTEIEEGETSTTIFKLDPAKSYWIYAACDSDCTDIDIEAADAAGKPVGSDDGQDAGPKLHIAPGQSGGEVHVTVIMATCDAEVCVAGLGLFEAAK